MKVSLLINMKMQLLLAFLYFIDMKMPIIVLIPICREHLMLSSMEHENGSTQSGQDLCCPPTQYWDFVVDIGLIGYILTDAWLCKLAWGFTIRLCRECVFVTWCPIPKT